MKDYAHVPLTSPQTTPAWWYGAVEAAALFAILAGALALADGFVP